MKKIELNLTDCEKQKKFRLYNRLNAFGMAAGFIGAYIAYKAPHRQIIFYTLFGIWFVIFLIVRIMILKDRQKYKKTGE